MFDFRFAGRYTDPAGSPIRELFPYLGRPGIISFAGGYPSPSLFDVEGLQEAGRQVLADGARGLQYGATEGEAPLREALVELCRARGIDRPAGDYLVTTGSQQAFDLLVRILVEPGDGVYLETPAYPAAIQAARLAGARLFEVPIDEDGLRIDALRDQLAAARPRDRPKLLYTVPTFSNPAGTLLPQARREALVRLAVEHGFVIVEDDPYGELAFTGERPEPLVAIGERLAAGRNPVVYLSSLSKTVAPALRVGWMIAPEPVLRRCAVAKQTVDLCTSPLAQAIAARYLRSGRYPAAVAGSRAEYARRMRAMAEGLRRASGGQLRFVEPKGGMFLWAECVTSLDSSSMFQAALDEGVLYVPGTAFYPARSLAGTLRLSYAAPGIDAIVEGTARLGRALG